MRNVTLTCTFGAGLPSGTSYGAPMSFLTLHSLSKPYNGQPVVSDADLSVGKGEFVSLLGPSGCGKTTTLQMIAGIVDPSSGRIMLDGRDITREKPNTRGLGIVFESYAQFQ